MNIYESIMNIDAAIEDSQDCVMESLFAAYDKSLKILEYYDGPELDCFSIFQEGSIMDDVKKRGEGQNALVKIITFIPRLIGAIISFLKNKFSKKNGPIANAVEEIKDLPKDKNKQKNLAIFLSLGAAATTAAVAAHASIKSKKKIDRLNSIIDEMNNQIFDRDTTISAQQAHAAIAKEISSKKTDMIFVLENCKEISDIVREIEDNIAKDPSNGKKSLQAFYDLAAIKESVDKAHEMITVLAEASGVNDGFKLARDEEERNPEKAEIRKTANGTGYDAKMFEYKKSILALEKRLEAVKKKVDDLYEPARRMYLRMHDILAENVQIGDTSYNVKIKTNFNRLIECLNLFNDTMKTVLDTGKIPDNVEEVLDKTGLKGMRYKRTFEEMTNDRGTGLANIIYNDDNNFYRDLNLATDYATKFVEKYKKEIKHYQYSSDDEEFSKETETMYEFYRSFINKYRDIYTEITLEYNNLLSICNALDWVLGDKSNSDELRDAVLNSRDTLDNEFNVQRGIEEKEDVLYAKH